MKREREEETGDAAQQPTLLTPPPLLAPPPLLTPPPPAQQQPAAAAAAAAASAAAFAAAAAAVLDFEQPAAAGALGSAQFWFYRDASGQEQGPQLTSAMRAWFEAGYFEGVSVAASYYGEVPDAFWPVAELWAEPATQAFLVPLALPPSP